MRGALVLPRRLASAKIGGQTSDRLQDLLSVARELMQLSQI
jgi:hypothetical protein